MHIIGDVAGRDYALVDDMIDTGGTLCKAAEVLKERGVKRVCLRDAISARKCAANNPRATPSLMKSLFATPFRWTDEIKAPPNVRTFGPCQV